MLVVPSCSTERRSNPMFVAIMIPKAEKLPDVFVRTVLAAQSDLPATIGTLYVSNATVIILQRFNSSFGPNTFCHGPYLLKIRWCKPELAYPSLQGGLVLIAKDAGRLLPGCHMASARAALSPCSGFENLSRDAYCFIE